MKENVPRDWLRSPVGFGEIEAWLADRARTIGPAGDNIASDWQGLKAQMLPGDEIWYFSSGPESWRQLAGREGYALVRDGDVIDSLITGMN